MGGAWLSKSIADPLEAHGLVVLGVGKPVVFVAVDWCEIRNDAYDRWRDALAEAAGTTAERVLVTALLFPWIQSRRQPLWAPRFNLPASAAIDRKLLAGAILFGIGWGIAGYCPGPAIAALLIHPAEAIPFVLAMLAGAWLQPRWLGR